MKLSNATTEPPKVLRDYWQNEPRVCWNCESYSGSGKCAKFNATPPADFAESDRACEAWTNVIPF